MVDAPAFARPCREEREGVLIENIDAFGNGFGVVVVALYEFRPRIRGKVALEVAWERLSGRGVYATSGETADGFFALEIEKDNEIFREHRVKEGFLVGASGNAVKNDAAALVSVAIVAENGSDEFGRNELSRIETSFNLGALFVAEGGKVAEFLPHFKK